MHLFIRNKRYNTMARVSFKERFIQGANVGANSFFKLFDSPKRNPAKYMQDT